MTQTELEPVSASRILGIWPAHDDLVQCATVHLGLEVFYMIFSIGVCLVFLCFFSFVSFFEDTAKITSNTPSQYVDLA